MKSSRRDLHQLDTEIHWHGEESGHTHIVEAGQPTDDHIGVVVDVGAGEHRLGIGDEVAVTDLDCLG